MPKECQTLTEKVLRHGDRVAFTPFTENYGTAEFLFCAIWKRGRLVVLYIHPLQQPDTAQHYYRVNANSYGLSVPSWSRYEPSPDLVGMWCKEHKCMCFRVYVPRESHSFTVSTLSTLSVNFEL